MRDSTSENTVIHAIIIKEIMCAPGNMRVTAKNKQEEGSNLSTYTKIRRRWGREVFLGLRLGYLYTIARDRIS